MANIPNEKHFPDPDIGRIPEPSRALCGIRGLDSDKITSVHSYHEVTCLNCLRMMIQAERAVSRTLAGQRDEAESSMRIAKRELTDALDAYRDARDEANGPR